MPHAALPAVMDHIRRLTRTPAAEGLTDRQLLQRFAAGRDEGAFEALVRRHGRLVLGVCRRVLRQEQDAEDAFQATFLVLARRAGSVRWQESVGGWLHEVARRVARGLRDRAGRRQARERTVAELPDVAAPQDGAARELGALLDEELLRLPERYRTPLLLCYLEGAPCDQAARQLGLSLRTLERRLHQGRESLRARLGRRGITLTAALLSVALAEQAAGRATAALAAATARAAAGFAARQAGAASARAAALAEAVLGGAVPVKVRAAGLLLLLIGVVGLGAGVLPPSPPAPPVPPEPQAQAAVGKRSPHADAEGDPLPPGAVNRFGTTHLRHGGPVNAVAFSPDAKLAACGAAYSDDDIRLWDTATGREVRVLKGHWDALNSVAFTPDGKRLVSSSRDGTTRVWDVQTGQELYRLQGHEGEVRDVAVSPDGKTIATAGADGTARLWERETGKELLQLRGHEGSVDAVTFSPDGKTVSTAGVDKTVRLWEAATGKETRSLEAHEAGASAVAFSPDGKTLATGGKSGGVRTWEAATGTSLRRFQVARQRVDGLAFSPDGKTLACAVQWGPPSLWDPATGTRKPWDVSWPGGDFGRVAFSPDGKTMLFGSGDHTARLIDVAALKERFPAGGHRGYVNRLSFTADGKGLMTAGADQTARLWDCDTGALLRQFAVRHSRATEAQAFSPDGATLACGDGEGVIRLYERGSGRELRVLARHGDTVRSLAYSPDGRVLASAGNDNTIRLWDAAHGKLLHTLRGHEGAVLCLAFSPDGRVLASGSADHAVRLWDAAAGKERYVLKGHQADLESLAFSPDGALLASSAREVPVHIWDVADGKELYQLKGHKTWVYCVAFSPDGRTLASGSLDNTVALWEVSTWAERARFVGHRGGVVALAFRADGRALASGASDGTALLWDLTGRAEGGRLASANLTPPTLEADWADLAGADAARAHRAIWELVAGPAQVLPLLRAELRPVAAVSEDRLRRLIAQLDDDDYTVREAATAELAGLGDAAEPVLRKAQQGATSIEQRQRLAYLLEKLRDQGGSPSRLRDPRALEVLEQIGTREARDVLAALAKGAPAARLTREARAALERLDRRPAPPPG